MSPTQCLAPRGSLITPSLAQLEPSKLHAFVNGGWSAHLNRWFRQGSRALSPARGLS